MYFNKKLGKDLTRKKKKKRLFDVQSEYQLHTTMIY